jgi:PII-like signaling protein
MLTKGPAKKVTIYLNEESRYHLVPLYEAIMTFLLHKGVAGATASRAMAGFGAHQTFHTTKIEVLSTNLPVRIVFVETKERVDELLQSLYDMVTDGLIEVQDTLVVKVAKKEKKPEPRHLHEKKQGKGKLMRIFLGEADRAFGEPLHDAIIKRLRMLDIAGATVHRGIEGYGVKGHTHKQSFWHLSKDMPLMISVIDTNEKISQAAEIVEELLQDGLIVISEVDVIRLVHSHSLEEANHAELPKR